MNLTEQQEFELMNAVIDRNGFYEVDFINRLQKNEGEIIKLFVMMPRKLLFKTFLVNESDEIVNFEFYLEFESKEIVMLIKSTGEQMLCVLGERENRIKLINAIKSFENPE